MPDDHRDTRPAPQASPLVLVVDDNPVTRYATVRVLTAAGYRTIEAESGQEALQRADLSVSAVVLDVNLPDIDGFQVCRSLRSRPETATVPVVHLSATYVADYDKVRGLDAGASAYLIHPAEPGVLVATIASLLRASAAERSMRESEARFRAIYHQAIGGICTLDLAGRFVDVNPAMLTMLGRPEAALVGQPVAAFAPPEFREKVAEATGHTGQTGWQGTFPLCDARGETMHLEWSISAVLETGVKVAVVSNITDHVNLERQREQLIEREQAARAAVERLNRMKDDFIAILSHELRNPLNVISVWTHVLARHIDSEEGRRGLAAVERNIAIQRRLVADLVDVSMLNVGKMKLERERVNLPELVRSAVDTMQTQAAERHVTLDLRLAPTVAMSAWLDAARFQQILWNLVSNAIKFSPEDGTVQIELSSDADNLHLRVIDNGRGIPQEFLPLLFDRFTQSEDANRRKHGGLGLGAGHRQAPGRDAWRHRAGVQRRRGPGRHLRGGDPADADRAGRNAAGPGKAGAQAVGAADGAGRADRGRRRRRCRRAVGHPGRLRRPGAHGARLRRGAGRRAAGGARPRHQRHRPARPRRQRPDPRDPRARGRGGAAARAGRGADRVHPAAGPPRRHGIGLRRGLRQAAAAARADGCHRGGADADAVVVGLHLCVDVALTPYRRIHALLIVAATMCRNRIDTAICWK